MPTSTYVPLGTITLASTDSEIVFSSIPATYRDLVLVFDATVSVQNNVRFIVNGDTTQSNYSYVSMKADPGASSAAFNFDDPYAFITTGRNAGAVQYFDVNATDKHKTYLHRFNINGEAVFAVAQRWANTNAVNSVAMRCGSGSFNIGSTFSLFGIA